MEFLWKVGKRMIKQFERYEGPYRFVEICIFYFWILLVWVPAGLNILKMFFLLPVLFVAIIVIARNKGKMVAPTSVKLIILMIVSNFFYCLYGLLVEAPGALRVMTIDVIWPIIYIFIYQIFPRKKDLYLMMFFFVLMGDVLAIYDLVYTFSNIAGVYNYVKPIYEFVNTGIHYGYSDISGMFSFNSDHGMFYLFFTPIAMTLTYQKVVLKDIKLMYLSSHFLVISCILLVLTNVLSGKRAIQMAVVITVLLLLFYGIKAKRKKTKHILLVYLMLAVIASILLLLNWNKVSDFLSYNIDNLFEGFKWTKTDIHSSEYARGKQAKTLINGWLDNPLFGHGAGSYAESYYRLKESIWSYELSYHALLFQKGVIGFTIFFLLVGYTIINLYKLIKNEDIRWLALPLLIGYFCFLIGNAFNPFFGRSSMLWIFYLPLLLCDSLPIIELHNDNTEKVG